MDKIKRSDILNQLSESIEVEIINVKQEYEERMQSLIAEHKARIAGMKMDHDREVQKLNERVKAMEERVSINKFKYINIL